VDEHLIRLLVLANYR